MTSTPSMSHEIIVESIISHSDNGDIAGWQRQRECEKEHATVTGPFIRAKSPHNSSKSPLFIALLSLLLALCCLPLPIVAIESTSHPPMEDQGKSDKEFLDEILHKDKYDLRILPPVQGTLIVNVSVLLLSLASPDESSLKYEVEFLLQQQWSDPRLEFSNYSGITFEYLNAIHHNKDIWLPDTYFIMHGDFKDPIIPMHFALRIYRNGTINYLMRRHLILSCQGRLNIFPFDDPLCSFSVESISYETSSIQYVWKNDEDTLRKSPSLTTLNAYLIHNKTDDCDERGTWRGNYSCLKVELTFTRDRAFYFTTVFIPGIILVTSSFITFWLEWNAVPARVMIGVTTMLNFFTTSNGFRSTLPVVSNLTAMNVWDGVCMCFIYASLLEFVCVNYVGRKRPLHNVVYRPGENPVTQRLPAVLSRFGMILASPLQTIENEFHVAMTAEKNASTATSSTITQQSTMKTSTTSASPQDDTQQQQQQPFKPPRQKYKTTSPVSTSTTQQSPTETTIDNLDDDGDEINTDGEKKREQEGGGAAAAGSSSGNAPERNEIVACTICASDGSPCTHTASNNGCATETCFVQMRKKEPPHPIRVAKTIDVIARITFPLAYAFFLIIFFAHKKFFAND